MNLNETQQPQNQDQTNESSTAVLNNTEDVSTTPAISKENDIEIVTKKRKTTKPNIARNPYEKAQQAIHVAKLWAITDYVLHRFTSEQMIERAQQLLLALVAKNTSKVQRNPLLTKLNALYDEATKSGARVKAYVRGSFEKADAEAKYQEFGFKYSKQNGYRLPLKREEFMASIDIMLLALQTYGYAEREFGTAYWIDFKQRYEQTFIDAGLQNIKWSEGIGTAEELLDEVHGMLVSVKKLVEAENYGNETRALRNMGFLREQN